MIRVGIAGLGFMGMIHHLAYHKVKGVKVAAMCEQDTKRLAGDWRAIKGNFGPAGTMMDLSGISKYEKLDDMLADPQLDMIDICLPPAAHAAVAIAALRAGKHVFCEKPIALVAADARQMVNAARKAGKQLMIGHVLPFFPEYAFTYQALRRGKYGRLLGGHFKRIISDPQWLKDFYDPAKIGGPMLDLHVHDAHYIRLLCGKPQSVFTTGRMRGQVAEYFTSQFLFDDPGLVVSASSGVINQQGRAFCAGFEVHFQRGTLLYDFAVINGQPQTCVPLTVLKQDGSVERPEMPSSDPIDAFAAELTEAAKTVKSGKPSALLDGELALDAIALCQKQTESLRKRRPVKC
ncbi:MAG TPA: Gfo/Idh/MocA family oxidoreductase [Pirellulales bacterium]|jgi:predicted dehydrogenase|nr:Gfo/Idh/MocA family oxidoreductase [Pirellulales bacterium]